MLFQLRALTKFLLKHACMLLFSAEDPDEIVETPSTTEEAEDEDDLEEDGEDSGGQDDPDSEQNMEVDPPNVTANPDKFQKLISFGQKVFDSIVNQSRSSEGSINLSSSLITLFLIQIFMLNIECGFFFTFYSKL